MIRNEVELQECQRRLRSERTRRAEYKRQLAATGLPAADLAHAIEPVQAFELQLEKEILEYRRAQHRELAKVSDLRDLCRTLVALRVAAGLTQRQLAARLGVHESLVSRDERNEYQGLTIQRAAQILEALGVKLDCSLRVFRNAVKDSARGR